MLEADKYIEVADGNFVTAKQTGEVQIKFYKDTGKHFIDMLYNVLFSPDLCNQLFFNIMLMNSVYTWLFPKLCCTAFFSNNKHNTVTLPHSEQQKIKFW